MAGQETIYFNKIKIKIISRVHICIDAIQIFQMYDVTFL